MLYQIIGYRGPVDKGVDFFQVATESHFFFKAAPCGDISLFTRSWMAAAGIGP